MAFLLRVPKQLVPVLIACALAVLPHAVFAGDELRAPTYAYEHESVEVIYGTITGFDGRYALQLRDDRGFFDNVQLVQGTIINPTGERLKIGARISVRGSNRGFAFFAAQIDTRNIEPATRSLPSPAALIMPHLRPPSPSREARRLEAARMRRYRSDLEAYRRAQEAYKRAEEVKARAAARRLADKLARPHGGQVRTVTAPHRTTHSPNVTRLRPLPAARPTAHPIASERSKNARPREVIKTRLSAKAPVTRSAPAKSDISGTEATTPWFGWGKL